MAAPIPPIPFFDYRPEYDELRDEILDAVQRVFASGTLILGPEVEAFEQEFAEYTGAFGAVGVGSGTDALGLALRALGVSVGDEVITVANAGAPPIAAIRSLGAMPRYVDVDPGTLQLDPGALEGAITRRTRCVVAVHLFGRAAPIDEILAVTESRGLGLVEDCAQAQGTRYRGRHVGTFGKVGCFSFYPTKNLGAMGDGGLCVSDDPRLRDRIRSMRMYGFDEHRESRVEGINSRLDELQAAILRVKLRNLERSVDERRRLASLYEQRLAATGCLLDPEGTTERRSHHLFVLKHAERDRLRERLADDGIGTGIHYAMPAHRMAAFARLPGADVELPVTERACGELLSLPIYPGLGDARLEAVCESVLALA